jgi:WD40 repeat protein
MIATGQPGGLIRLWDFSTGRELHRMTSPQEWIASLLFSADAKRLGSAGGPIGYWVGDLATGKERGRFGAARTASDGAAALSPDGRILAAVHTEQPEGSSVLENWLRLWDVQTGKELRRLGGKGRPIECLAFSPDCKHLATGAGDLGMDWADHSIRLWEVATRRELCRIEGHGGAVTAVAFSADGRLLASGSTDTTILTWNFADLLRTRKP